MAAKEGRRRGRGVALVMAWIAIAAAAVWAFGRSSARTRLPGTGAVTEGARTVTSPPPPRVDPPAPVTVAPPVTAPVTETPPVTGTPPAAQRPTAAQAGDDLTAIDGIGPKISAALVDAGITTFRALADTSADRLREVLAQRGLRFTPTLDTWPAQARSRLG